MRGFGFFGGLVDREGPAHEQAWGRIEEQFVDGLRYEYFIAPVVTVLPENIWVTRRDDGGYLVESAISNIGGMDSGPVTVKLYADGKLLKSTRFKQVPAGNSLMENQASNTYYAQ